jgi:hypothetical protein
MALLENFIKTFKEEYMTILHTLSQKTEGKPLLYQLTVCEKER